MTQPFDRRRFLTLAGGGAVVVALGGCRTGRTGDGAGNTTTTAATTTPTTAAATTAAPTTTSAAPTADDRILVLVQLNGGNDGLNTLVPADGRYRDARPGLGVPEADLVPLAGEAAYALHPALAPLVGPWEAGRMAFVQGVGFPDPDRSHFVAMDTWWRAGDHGAPTGWLGRVLDGWPTDPEPLFATALGGGAPLLLGTRRQPTVVLNAESFRFAPGIDPALLSALAMPPAAHPLMAAAQGATARAVEAVEAFADLAGVDPAEADEPAPAREGGSTLADGLATAARMITGDVGARIVVVSAGGFDTHANQAPTQQQLLADLASGLSAFVAAVDQAGMPTGCSWPRPASSAGGSRRTAVAARIMAPVGCPSCWARFARACTDRSTSATCWTATSVPPSIHASSTPPPWTGWEPTSRRYSAGATTT